MPAEGRAALRMTSAEVDAFLAEERRVQFATLDENGQVDLVPLSYLLWEGRLAVWTDPQSKKVRNLRRNRAVSCLVEAGAGFDDMRAVQLRGHAEVIEDPEISRLAGEVLFARHHAGPLSQEARAQVAALAPDRVLVVVHPERVVSWDHRKLRGLSPAEVGR